jgi:Putative peptidoglycan binding domain
MRITPVWSLALLLGAYVALVAFARHAAASPRRARAHAAEKVHKPRVRVPKGHRPTRARTPGAADDVALARFGDEVILSPMLLKRLQTNLVDGGYLHGTCDGRLTPRTRRALALFQLEYHMQPTGRLDRATADALLGREVIASYLATAQ